MYVTNLTMTVDCPVPTLRFGLRRGITQASLLMFPIPLFHLLAFVPVSLSVSRSLQSSLCSVTVTFLLSSKSSQEHDGSTNRLTCPREHSWEVWA